MQIILWALLCYILYRFVVGFLIPVVSTASRMRRQFKEMNQQASAYTNAQHNNYTGHTEENAPSNGHNHANWTTSGKKAPKEDYIDFEEVPKPKS